MKSLFSSKRFLAIYPGPAVWICLLLLISLSLPVYAAVSSSEPVDLDVVTRIRQEGFRNSHAMQMLSEITDRIGPRLTGSPQSKVAHEWTRDELQRIGLVNAHVENYGPFGRGWQADACFVRMIAPDTTTLWAIPKAWTPGTNGVVRGKLVRAKISKPEDMEQYRGKLAGAIVLLGEMPELTPPTSPFARRHDDKSLDTLAQYAVPGPDVFAAEIEKYRKALELQKAIQKFLADEKAVAVIEPSVRGDSGALFVSDGGSYKAKEPQAAVPVLAMLAEHYGRLSRLLEHNVLVELELDVRTRFFDNAMAYNTVAEIPGTDKKDEVVMLGGHLDSWHGGTGATDDASGVVAAMEAVRILKALGVQPRRTIRVALWSGEEQGLLGSRSYVAQHFIASPDAPKEVLEDDLGFLSPPKQQLRFKPEWGKVSAYFGIDNGAGKLRGIYLQENAAVRPIFEAWMEPLKDLGFTTITMRNTFGTDHNAFDLAGIPGFQFIQDPLDYGSRVHHSNLDVYERVPAEDLMQQSVILASFVYEVAMRDQLLPRKPAPKPESK